MNKAPLGTNVGTESLILHDLVLRVIDWRLIEKSLMRRY